MAMHGMMGLGALLAGVSGGILSGLFGIGGGIILIPMLGLLLGLNQHQAQGVTLAAMLLPNGLPAVIHFRRRGIPIHWPVVGALTAGFLPAVWTGAALANRVPGGPLRAAFGVLLIVMALQTWFKRTPAPREGGGAPALGSMVLAGLGIGFLAGLASGFFGIGGGLVIIPLLIVTLGLTQLEAQAACLAFMLAPIGLPGVIVYARHQGGLPWVVLAGVAAGFLCGAYLGARIATRIHGPWLRRAFALLMGTVAIFMLI